ncbi:MAG: hypothetical protein JWM91_2885 [Rhodospirillales bacterium]|nr:hypothetical protein [Rhodospirillales bacterium]
MTRLNDGTACTLPDDEQEAFERAKDPYLAMGRLSLAVERLATGGDSVDEEDETRAGR